MRSSAVTREPHGVRPSYHPPAPRIDAIAARSRNHQCEQRRQIQRDQFAVVSSWTLCKKVKWWTTAQAMKISRNE